MILGYKYKVDMVLGYKDKIDRILGYIYTEIVSRLQQHLIYTLSVLQCTVYALLFEMSSNKVK